MALVLLTVRVAPEDADLTIAAGDVLHCEAFQLKPVMDGQKTVMFSSRSSMVRQSGWRPQRVV